MSMKGRSVNRRCCRCSTYERASGHYMYSAIVVLEIAVVEQNTVAVNSGYEACVAAIQAGRFCSECVKGLHKQRLGARPEEQQVHTGRNHLVQGLQDSYTFPRANTCCIVTVRGGGARDMTRLDGGNSQEVSDAFLEDGSNEHRVADRQLGGVTVLQEACKREAQTSGEMGAMASRSSSWRIVECATSGSG